MTKILLLPILVILTSCDQDMPHWNNLIDTSDSSSSSETTTPEPVSSVEPISPEEEEEEVVETPVSTCDPVENFIVNGSFEEDHGLGNEKWGVFSNIPGWYAMLELRDAGIEIQNGQRIGGLSPTDGNAKIELDAHPKNGFTESDAIVAQDIEISVSGKFKLSFDYSPRVKNQKKSNMIKVYFAGKKIKKLKSKKVGWKHYEITITAQEGTQRLRFQAVKDKDTLGGFIDNVKLTRVCE